jgi:hypothetical protein
LLLGPIEEVLNLVSNAFNYSKNGHIEVGVEQSGSEIHLTVKDTGAGIPEDQQDKIFHRFYRIGNTQGRSLEGTGIGLAMVKELVSLQDAFGKSIQHTPRPAVVQCNDAPPGWVQPAEKDPSASVDEEYSCYPAVRKGRGKKQRWKGWMRARAITSFTFSATPSMR